MLSPALAGIGWVVLTIRVTADVPQSRGGLGLESLEWAFWYSAILLGALAGRARNGMGRVGLALGIAGLLGSAFTLAVSRSV